MLQTCSLIALRAALYLPPPQAARDASAHSAEVGVCSRAQAPRNQGSSPVLSTFYRALRCSTHESFHVFADRSPGRQGEGSLSALFISFVAALFVFLCGADLTVAVPVLFQKAH